MHMWLIFESLSSKIAVSAHWCTLLMLIMVFLIITIEYSVKIGLYLAEYSGVMN